MKILKYLLLLLLVVLVAGAIYVATRPNDYDVVRSKVIKAPINMVFNNINDYRNWEAWGPWMEEDTTIVVKYNEQTSGVGANYSWTSKDGPGKMKTVSLTQNKSIEQQMQFGDYEPTDVYWTFEEVPEGTKVSWGMKSDKTAFIFKLFATLGGGMDKMLGDMEEKGLDNIEREILAELEKNPPKPKFRIGEVSSTSVTAQKFIGYHLQSKIDHDVMTKLFTEYMPKAGMYAYKQKLVLGEYTPGAVFTKFDQEKNEADFYIGVLLKKDIAPAEGMDIVMLPEGKAIMVSKFGYYGTGDEQAHMALDKYMQANNLTQNGPIWELYVNDPTSVKPEDVQTDIYYPVKAAE